MTMECQSLIRAIDALTQRQLTKLFYTNGVHADNNGKNNFRVNAGTGMTVVVDPGSCCIEGVYGIEDDQRTLAIQAADSMDRIDRVVIRLNDAERKIVCMCSKHAGQCTCSS